MDANLTAALDLLEQCQATYAAAPEHLKRQLNQALFEKILVVSDHDAPDRITMTSTLNAPFDGIVELAHLVASESDVAKVAGNERVETSPSLLGRNSLSNRLLVGLVGLEPTTRRPVLGSC